MSTSAAAVNPEAAVRQRLSFREKAGYSLGDSSANFVFQVLMAYQVFYFTEIMGIAAGAVSFLLLFGRLWDAVTDPVMGMLADRTRTRWGRFRPWLVWSALPFAVIFWLTFTSPGWASPQMMIVYAYVSYLALMTVYTVNNIPYCALNGVMTGDVDERTSLSTYRFVAAMITGFVVQGLTAPMAAKFGGDDPAKGWSTIIGIYAIIAFCFFFVTFFAVRERVKPDPNQVSSVMTDVKDTFRNIAWRVLFFVTLLIFIMLAFRGGALYHFFSYNVEREALFGFLGQLGLAGGLDGGLGTRVLNAFGLIVLEDRSNVQAVGFGVFNMAGGLIQVIGVLASKPLSHRFGKKGVFATSMAATAVATAWLFFIPGDNPRLMFIQGITWGLCYSPSIPLLWSMIADSADFSEWKSGRRATGLVFAGVVFALKAGLGIGGFLGAQVLAAYGYDPGAPITDTVLMGIRLAATLFPALAILFAGGLMLLYPITKAINYEMAAELQARRRSFGSPE